MTFYLNPRLAADTIPLCDLALSQFLLMNDARFCWAILVPRRAEKREIIDLDKADRAALFAEIEVVSQILRDAIRPDKLNIGIIGNMVPQLHVHIVARFESDIAWPKPVWGFGAAEPYSIAAFTEQKAKLLRQLDLVRPDLIKKDLHA